MAGFDHVDHFAIQSMLKDIFQTALLRKAITPIRHWTATTAHIQLMVGITLYFQSPRYQIFPEELSKCASRFFLFILWHACTAHVMLAAIVVVTIGSALAKRKETDKEKFRTILVWYSIALFIIFIAIPWPFSPPSCKQTLFKINYAIII